MQHPSIRRRRAFTVLEVILAMAIGLLLMVGLYVALDIQLANTQAGRVIVEQSTLARALLNRMGSDISSNLAPVNPSNLATSGNQNAGATSASASSSTSGTSGSANSAAAAANTSGLGPVNFNLGVQGDSATLTLFVSRLPRDVTNGLSPNDATVVQPSDLRRITYWLAGDAANPLGLARQEVPFVTSTDQVSVVPPNVPDPASFVLAEEVKSLQFEYFDGNTWQSSWDGTAAGSDGVTPQGPPAAIAITLTVARTGAGARSQEDPNPRQYRHVVAIPTANNFNPQATTSGSNP